MNHEYSNACHCVVCRFHRASQLCVGDLCVPYIHLINGIKSAYSCVRFDDDGNNVVYLNENDLVVVLDIEISNIAASEAKILCKNKIAYTFASDLIVISRA